MLYQIGQQLVDRKIPFIWWWGLIRVNLEKPYVEGEEGSVVYTSMHLVWMVRLIRHTDYPAIIANSVNTKAPVTTCAKPVHHRPLEFP